VAVLAFALAPSAFAQYYGKNKIMYDHFRWEVYHSPHFDIYFYPEARQHLDTVASLAESAYLKVSSDLKHQIPFAVPLIYYKTHSEFEQTNLFPDILPEGVLAFAESLQNRMVLPIDLPIDELQNLITHELTHIFEYSILYQGLNSPLLQIRAPPTWVFEGLSDFTTGHWDLVDLMTVRDMVVTDRMPTIREDGELESETFGGGRADYNVGHAIYDYMQERWGLEGIRQFWWSLKRGTRISKDANLMESLKIKPGEFDSDWKKYMRERFKDFRTKEIPVDYGRDLAPQGKLFSVFAMEMSPSGDIIAVLTGNRSDMELDLVLLAARDGKVIKNLTKGYTNRYQSIHAQFDPSEGDALAWSRDGDWIAFLARTGKRRSLFLVKVTSGKIARRFSLNIDEATAPAFYPDGKAIMLAGLQDGVADLFKLSIDTGAITNVTKNTAVERSPAFSADGKLIAYTVRSASTDKIYVGPADDPSSAVQKTFGEGNDVNPSFSPDSKRIYYSCSAPDGIYNLFTLDLETGERQQWTDVLGGNFYPLRVPGEQERVLFTSYYKGNFGLYNYELKKPLRTYPLEVAQQTQAEEPFEPEVTHMLQPAGIHKRDTHKLLFAGQPPINVGVTSDGTFYGGTAIAMTDMLGDHQYGLVAYTYREFETIVFSYTNLRRRLQYQFQAYTATDFYYVNPDYLFSSYAQSQNEAIATDTYRGGLVRGIYPIDLFRRIEFSGGVMYYKRSLADYMVNDSDNTGLVKLFGGWYTPLEASFTHDSTRYKGYGPIAGSVLHVSGTYAPGSGDNMIGRQMVYGDARKYFRLTAESLVATRFVGFYSTGDDPGYIYMGGNNQLRGVEYMRMVGDRGWFFNAELRFPFIHAVASPIGVLGPLRGTLYFDMGFAHWKGDGREFSSDEGGFHLVDGSSSFGGGIEFFLFSYPLHLDFVKRTDFQTVESGTDVKFWIGYDF